MEELIPITMFLCVAAVAILRPITTRLGGLLEAMTRAKIGATGPTPPQDEAEMARLRNMMEHVSKRLDLIEERLDFTERLVDGGKRTAPTPLFRDDTLRAREERLRP